MPLTQAQEAIYHAAVKADSNFSAELKRVYGKRSQDMRYRPQLWTDRALKASALKFKRATDRWLTVMRSFRSSNPTWHQKRGMRGKSPKLAPGWWIADDTGGFLSYIGPIATEKEAKDLLDLRAKNGAKGVIINVREQNPGRKFVHTAKWDRCVREVRKRGTAADPYAVCTAAMGEMAVRPSHRRANPLPKLTSVRAIYYAVSAKRGNEKFYLKRNGKLTRKESDAARFTTVGEAQRRAVEHLRRYPASRSFHFSVGLAY